MELDFEATTLYCTGEHTGFGMGPRGCFIPTRGLYGIPVYRRPFGPFTLYSRCAFAGAAAAACWYTLHMMDVLYHTNSTPIHHLKSEGNRQLSLSAFH
jgi:hypothetical protein